MKLTRKKYEKRMSKLQQKIEKLKEAVIVGETGFEVGKFYESKLNGRIVLCTSVGNGSRSSGVCLVGCDGHAWGLVLGYDGLSKDAFNEIAPNDFTIEMKRK